MISDYPVPFHTSYLAWVERYLSQVTLSAESRGLLLPSIYLQKKRSELRTSRSLLGAAPVQRFWLRA